MQMGLALLAFLVTIPWVSIVRRLRTGLNYCLRILSRKRRSNMAKHQSPASSAQGIPNREPPGALTSALVSFQKAQCWFMLATNIASLVVKKNGGLDLGNYQALFNTYIFIKVIAIGGYLPITFTLLNLHMINQLSWYPIILSIVTMAIATATLATRGTAFTLLRSEFDNINSATLEGGPRSCAYRNLKPFCYNPLRNGNYFGFNASSSGSGANDILVFCYITLAIIVVDHFCRSDDPKQRNINHWVSSKLGFSISKPLFSHAGAILHYGTIAFHFIFFWLYIYCFYTFGKDLEWFGSNHVNNPTWSFGQIVAILVWAPTLVDYMWEQFRGYRKGAEHKTPRMYEVVKRVQEQRKESEPEEKELPY